MDYETAKLDVESEGALSLRVRATQTLNTALARSCAAQAVAFTGVDTWAFARTSHGSLRPELSSSGRTTIDPKLCTPIHEVLRELIREELAKRSASDADVRADGAV
jgi:hypothetical protein